MAVLVRFSLVSLLGTALDFLVLWLLVAHAGVAVVPAKLVATEATIVNTFAWNNVWTFRGRADGASLSRRFLSFNAMYIGSLVLSLLIVGLLVAAFGQRYYLVYNALTLPVNFIWNYLWSTLVIWRVRPSPPRMRETPAPRATGVDVLPAAEGE